MKPQLSNFISPATQYALKNFSTQSQNKQCEIQIPFPKMNDFEHEQEK